MILFTTKQLKIKEEVDKMRKKGISLVSISIAVIVMLVLVSTISVSLTFSITNAKKMAFAKEIYNIQSLVDEYMEREETLPPTLETIQITPSDMSQFNLETLSNGTLLLETLDLPSLDIKSTSYGNKEIGEDDTEKAKDVYAVSLATGKVYYIAGFEIAGKKYYTLTDELRQMIEKKQNLTVGEKTVTFTPSVVGWGKDGISVTVAVPSEFTSPSLEISNANIKYTSTTANGVLYYNVNTEKVAENYTVTVNYTKGGVVSSATYSAKIDKTAPVISKDTSVSNVTGKVNGLKATDTESGIKYFKYAEGVISLSDANSYMKAYGKNITNGSINFKNSQNYTLYAEDKAGNYSIIYVDINGQLVTQKPGGLVMEKAIIWSEGSGTQDDPYIISKAENLAYLSNQVNAGNNYENVYFSIGNTRINLADLDEPFIPIGNSEKNAFQGSIIGSDPENTCISNLKVGYVKSENKLIKQEKNYQGFIGYAGEKFDMQNINFSDVDIVGGEYCGIVGYNKGEIKNCIINVSVEGKKNVGGITGYNAGTISNNMIQIKVTGNENVGGIAGYNNHVIEYNTMYSATVTGTNYIGGIAGYNNATINANSTYGLNVTGKTNFGDLVGGGNAAN